jgi:protein SCO1/2
LVATAIYFGREKKAESIKDTKINGILLPSSQKITNFAFTDHNGKTFTEQNLKNHWTMMFFGFTNCAMVCPTTMAELDSMYKQLEKDKDVKEMPQIVMVSVDPERDTMEKMNEYVNTFNPKFLGVRADITETVALEHQLHIAAAKIESDGTGANHYTINHTAEILLFNPKGELQAYLSYPHKGDKLAVDYKNILLTHNG